MRWRSKPGVVCNPTGGRRQGVMFYAAELARVRSGAGESDASGRQTKLKDGHAGLVKRHQEEGRQPSVGVLGTRLPVVSAPPPQATCFGLAATEHACRPTLWKHLMRSTN